MRRRLAWTLLLAISCAWLCAAAAAQDYAQVKPGTDLQFPRDHGSHPLFRTEWWYITGWVKDARGVELGLQITFFRNRPRLAESNPSAFAPRQLLFAHAALADAKTGRLLHDQRAARAGFGLAEASEERTGRDEFVTRDLSEGFPLRMLLLRQSLPCGVPAAATAKLPPGRPLYPARCCGVGTAAAQWSRSGPHWQRWGCSIVRMRI